MKQYPKHALALALVLLASAGHAEENFSASAISPPASGTSAISTSAETAPPVAAIESAPSVSFQSASALTPEAPAIAQPASVVNAAATISATTATTTIATTAAPALASTSATASSIAPIASVLAPAAVAASAYSAAPSAPVLPAVVAAPAAIAAVAAIATAPVAVASAMTATPANSAPAVSASSNPFAATHSTPTNNVSNSVASSAPVAAAPRVMVARNTSKDMLDVTDLDAKLAALEATSKHYPPRFDDKQARRMAEMDIKKLVQALDQHAVLPDASYEVLIRAMKANQIARNLDVGMDSALKAGVYIRRLLELKPLDAEANLWYGIMLVEGGGMKEGIPYLNKAVKAGVHEAYLSLANAYLSLSKRDLAIKSLESYRSVATNDQPRAQSLIEAVRSGKTGIW